MLAFAMKHQNKLVAIAFLIAFFIALFLKTNGYV
jgi:hypothetical protein